MLFNPCEGSGKLEREDTDFSLKIRRHFEKNYAMGSSISPIG
jgi:hypothetical protein